ncbi:MAG: hypothetical protein M1822_005492 [Bathelium mastoideum]|nr:MAG: hypothetical protein M1822_005492 [Bathelium mastoideum]
MVVSSGSDLNVPDESPAQRQARLRRERRQQKVTSGGKDRLQAIASLSGRTVAQMDEAAAAANITHQPTVIDDPDEVDISQPYQGQPSPNSIRPSQAPSKQGANDPTSRLMQQILGADPNDPSARNQSDANDPLMRMMQQVMSGPEPEHQTPPTGQVYLWRVIHAFFALALALYIGLSSTFSGSKFSRSTPTFNHEPAGGVPPRLFWTFATAELVLQSTRYFLEKGRLPGSGLLGMIGSMLPEPFKGYLAIAARYGIIWTTVVSDAMVIVFVFGALAWWKGEVMT